MTVYPCKTTPVNFGNTHLLQAFTSSFFLFLLVLDALTKGETEVRIYHYTHACLLNQDHNRLSSAVMLRSVGDCWIGLLLSLFV